jgi:hypothetical protein
MLRGALGPRARRFDSRKALDLRELRYCKNTQCAKKDREWNDHDQRSSAHKDFLVAGHMTQTAGIS